MLQKCKRASAQDSIALAERDLRLVLKDQQLENRQLALEQWEGKFNLADGQIKKERKKELKKYSIFL